MTRMKLDGQLDEMRFAQWGRWWLCSDGTIMPVVAGAADGGADDDEPDDDEPDDDKGTKGKPLTDEQLNRIAAREKAKGQRQAATEIAEKLGMPVDDAVKLIQQAQAQDAEKLTEAEKRERAAAEKEAAAERREAAAAQREHEANVRDALREAGIPKAKVAKAARLLDVEVGASDDDLAAEIETLRSEWSELFHGNGNNDDEDDDDTNGTKDDKPKVPSGKSGSKPPSGSTKNASTALQRGRDRAKARQGTGGN